MHGQITGVFKNQIDWLPLNTGSVRPTQGRTCAVLQVNGGSQSFNGVNELRKLAHDAAKKAGFCSGSECTEAELAAWAKAEGRHLPAPLGALGRLLASHSEAAEAAEARSAPETVTEATVTEAPRAPAGGAPPAAPTTGNGASATGYVGSSEAPRLATATASHGGGGGGGGGDTTKQPQPNTTTQ